jgi:hypothetical protein
MNAEVQYLAIADPRQTKEKPMLDMVLRVWMAATFATMMIFYGLHFATEMREAVSWFYHRDGSDQSTKP